MSQTSTTVEVRILDKEYLVACPQEEQEALLRAARHLDTKMREIRSSGKVFGTERIAVMAALNITHELLVRDTMSHATSNLLRAMDNRLDEALGESSRSEEHTSELQSRPHLVCRLLLEKKKITTKQTQTKFTVCGEQRLLHRWFMHDERDVW